MRMGIGIGWPNASASNQSQMVYFEIVEQCGAPIPTGATTQLVNAYIYQSDDYVDYDNGGEDTGRVILGNIVENIGSTVFNISGSIYTSCPT